MSEGMSEQEALIKAKQKAYEILEAQGVLAAILRIVGSSPLHLSSLEEFNSPIKGGVTTHRMTTEAKSQTWEHFAFTVGEQSIEVRFNKRGFKDDRGGHRAVVHVLHNEEQVLLSNGSMYKQVPYDKFRFDEFGATYLELVKLNEVWIAAVNEIFDELRRVSKLAGDRISLSIEEAAKKEQSKFDLGGYE
jgi:hypothetical protein